MTLLYILAGVATAFNICVIIAKWKADRRLDAILDCGLAILLVNVFAGAGQGGIIMAMCASAIVSFYLLVQKNGKIDNIKAKLFGMKDTILNGKSLKQINWLRVLAFPITVTAVVWGFINDAWNRALGIDEKDKR
jgi:hypothetical protein